MKTWQARAELLWYVEGVEVERKKLTFEVRHPPWEPNEARSGATLRLLCAALDGRFATPARRVHVWVDGEDDPFRVAATWRDGAYVYSTTIARVQKPPAGAELVGLYIENAQEGAGK